MNYKIKHEDASITIEKLDTGKNRVSVESKNKNLFIAYKKMLLFPSTLERDHRNDLFKPL